MNYFENPSSQYIIISSEKLDDVISVLHAKCYTVLPIKGFYHGQYEDSVLAYGDVQNDELRKDVLLLLKLFSQDCAIVKYSEESGAKKLFPDGSEKPLGIVMFNTDSDNKSYLYDGLSFSFVESKRYWTPKKLEDIKQGMIVEYLSNNKWFQKIVDNPKKDWDDLIKLLVKYDKVRVPSES
jgi:hypothetical protein